MLALAGAYAANGDDDKAKKVMTELLRADPHLSVAWFQTHLPSLSNGRRACSNHCVKPDCPSNKRWYQRPVDASSVRQAIIVRVRMNLGSSVRLKHDELAGIPAVLCGWHICD